MALAAIHLNGPADEVLLVPARTVLKTSSGKIRRAACRELYDKGLLEAPRRAVWLQLADLVGQAIVASLRRGGQRLGTACLWRLLLAGVLRAVGGRRSSGSRSSPTPRARFGFAHIAAKAMLRAVAHAADRRRPRTPACRQARGDRRQSCELHRCDRAPRRAALGRALRRQARIRAHAALRRSCCAGSARTSSSASIPRAASRTRASSRPRSRRGETVVFFPEGTFSRAPGLTAFRLGAFAVSAETGAPVVPIVLRGTRSVLREHRWLPSRVPVTVSVQPPVMPTGRDWSAAVRLRDRVREVMLRHCGEPDLTR